MTHEVVIKTRINTIPSPRKVQVHRYEDGAFLGETTTDANGDGVIAVPDGRPVWVRSADDFGDPWAASTAFAQDALTFPISVNGHYYRAEAGGTTDAIEPEWPTNGGTVVDGSVTWRDVGTIREQDTTGPFMPTPV